MSDMGPPRRRRSGDGRPRRRSQPRYEDEYEDDRYDDDRYEDDRPYREPSRKKKSDSSTSPAATVLIIGGVLAALGIVVCAGAILYTFGSKFTDPGGGVNPELEEARMQEALRSGQ